MLQTLWSITCISKPTIILVFLIKDIFQISKTFSIGIIQTCSSLLHFLTENKLNLWSKFSENLNPRANVSLFLLRMESKRNMQGQNIERHLEKATTELHVSPFLHRDSLHYHPVKGNLNKVTTELHVSHFHTWRFTSLPLWYQTFVNHINRLSCLTFQLSL